MIRVSGAHRFKTDQGEDSNESAYYLSANRGKYSVAIDMASVKGQALIKKWYLKVTFYSKITKRVLLKIRAGL